MADASRAVALVEDEWVTAKMYKYGLQLAGYTVTVHRDGSALLAALRDGSFRPDMVVLDWMMPGMDGGALLLELRRDAALIDLPVVVLSNTLVTRSEARANTAQYGVLEWMQKVHTTPSQLAEKIRVLLNSPPAG